MTTKRVYNRDMNKLIVILSLPRCGTKSLALALGYPHQPGVQPTNPPMRKLMRRTDKNKIWVEINNNWRKDLKELTRLYPDATYIHLIRDGRDVVKSLRSLTSNGWKGEPLPILGFAQMPRFEKLCHFWVYWNTIIERNAPCNSRIRLEDISPLLPHIHQSKGNITAFSQSEEIIFTEICAELMDKYGYKT